MFILCYSTVSSLVFAIAGVLDGVTVLAAIVANLNSLCAHLSAASHIFLRLVLCFCIYCENAHSQAISADMTSTSFFLLSKFLLIILPITIHHVNSGLLEREWWELSTFHGAVEATDAGELPLPHSPNRMSAAEQSLRKDCQCGLVTCATPLTKMPCHIDCIEFQF